MELFDAHGRKLRRTIGFDSFLVVDKEDSSDLPVSDVIGSNLSYYSGTLEQIMDKSAKSDNNADT